MTWPPPFDWTGTYVGACRLAGPLEELELELELAEELPDEPAGLEPPEVPVLDEPELPVWELAGELPESVTVVCVEPGSPAATAPAAATLAKLTVTVVAFSRRRPRSRSATACETLDVPSRPARVARGAPTPRSELPMPPVWHTRLDGLSGKLLSTL